MRFAGRVLGSALLGALTAPPALALAVTGFWPVSGRLARRLAGLELRRLGVQAAEHTGGQALRYLALRWPIGLLGGIVAGLLALGVSTGVQVVAAWVAGRPFDGMLPTVPLLLYLATLGIVLLFLDICGLVGVYRLERHLAQRLLGPRSAEALERRIAELAHTRAGVLAAVDSERRRIERDLHDGLQQRLVALAMLVGRARRGRPEALEQAHEQAQRALTELREVAWRVYPSGLDALGLGEALAGLAERAALPVRLSCALERRPPREVETAAYFVVCEAVTNAAKHAGASQVTVEVAVEVAEAPGPTGGPVGRTVRVRVADDGKGGADPAGGGLSGLARRVAALDGRFTVTSPDGGPTVVTAELPCA
ncbi:sensor histidine kinase [Thermoactinospora rubra]|uniref:sensor histidine kinase n=1 Tax=Thermoactinospora rubra TaxID=1088767 RepID=UPI000A0F6F5E|nr:histidine kinase [Thermoactinospora rubra]